MRSGDWIQTYSGRRFYPLDPRPDEVHIADIAHALSNQCRFAGHTLRFYSVAEHSYHVSLWCPPDVALWGLLHDAAEAYLVDLPRPIKHAPGLGPHYREAEARITAAVCARFQLEHDEPPTVKQTDTDMLFTERRDLMLPMAEAAGEWGMGLRGLPLAIDLTGPRIGPTSAEHMFLRRYAELTEGVIDP